MHPPPQEVVIPPPLPIMPPSTTPFDIINIIIRLAYEVHGVSALRACAQVSHLFRLASRPIIFRKITLRTGDKLAALEALLEADPNIGPHIRTLVIHPLTAEPVPAPTRWLAGIPRILPAKLSRLRHFELVNLYELGGHCNAKFFAGCTAFTSVETLTLRDSVIELHLLYSFACAFPNITQLAVGNIRPVLAAYWPYPPQLLSLKLASIILDVGHLYLFALKGILRWLGETESIYTLRSFTAVFLPPEVQHVGLYLREHGSLLEELTLHIRDLPGTEQEIEVLNNALNLSACTNLQSLALRGFSPTMSPILTGISSPHFRELRLHIRADDPTTLPDLAPVALLLDSNGLQTIKQLTIMYEGPLPPDVVLGGVYTSFPEARHRALVTVVFL